MIAVDTNILIRVFSSENEGQHKLAVKLFSENTIFISISVILEAEWVLRSIYKLSKSELTLVFDTLAKSENVFIADNAAFTHALSLFQSGLDFADALHLALSNEAEKFVTFDKALAKNTPSNHLPAVEVL